MIRLPVPLFLVSSPSVLWADGEIFINLSIYFPTQSFSRFTVSPTALWTRFVWLAVCGMTDTRKFWSVTPVSYTHLDVYKRQAYDWDFIEEDARKAGVDCFIPKPLFRNSLFGAFAGAVKGSRPVEEKAEKPDFDNCRILLAEDKMCIRDRVRGMDYAGVPKADLRAGGG